MTSTNTIDRRDARLGSSLPRRDVLVSVGATGRELTSARRIAEARAARLRFVDTEELLDRDEHDRSALVVVAERETYFGRPLAERAHAKSGRPVLQVRAGGPDSYAQIVVATDVSSALDDMVAAAQFVSPASPLVFLHAYDNPFESMLYMNGAGRSVIGHHRRESARSARGLVRAHMKRLGLGTAPLRLAHGAPQFVLRRVPRRALLVVNRGRSRLKHVLFGSVTRCALEETTCDVLVV